MPYELTFSDSIPYPDNDGGILLYVVLSKAGLRATAEAVVDSGGSVCLFSRELGVSLGLEIETGIPKRLDSLGGPVDSFGHEVTLETAGLTFQSIVYYAGFPKYQGYLGDDLCEFSQLFCRKYGLDIMCGR